MNRTPLSQGVDSRRFVHIFRISRRCSLFVDVIDCSCTQVVSNLELNIELLSYNTLDAYSLTFDDVIEEKNPEIKLRLESVTIKKKILNIVNSLLQSCAVIIFRSNLSDYLNVVNDLFSYCINICWCRMTRNINQSQERLDCF